MFYDSTCYCRLSHQQSVERYTACSPDRDSCVLSFVSLTLCLSRMCTCMRAYMAMVMAMVMVMVNKYTDSVSQSKNGGYIVKLYRVLQSVSVKLCEAS
jgi:hypothetical protein